jgi:flavodoxin
MKSLIICKSIHVGNTEKIARRMAKILKSQISPQPCRQTATGHQ